jgi:hypothetical protein
MALNLFASKVDALKVDDSSGSKWFIGDKLNPDLTAAAIGSGNYLFDPKTGKAWSSNGSVFTETTETLPAGTVDNAILKWDSGTSSWVEETDFTVTDAGLATAAAGLVATTGGVTASAGDIVATLGDITASAGNIAATLGSLTAGTTVTAGTGITSTTGNIAASSGNMSASGTVTAGTGVIATTGGVTATAGGLTATAGGLSVVAGTSALSGGAVNVNNAAANTMTFSGTTNTIDLNGSGATAITLGGTTSTVTLSGSGTKKVTGLDTPVGATDAANKAYVDAVASGLSVKAPTKYATTGVLNGTPTYNNGTGGVGATLTGSSNNVALVIDGYTFIASDVTNSTKILVKDQASALQNGVYEFTQLQTASLPYKITRVVPYDEPAEITDGSFFFNTDGATNADKGYVQTAVVTAIGTDSIVFQQFSSSGGGVTSIPTESGTASPSGSAITITGSPSIDTSASGSTVTVSLAADLDVGATGFTVTNRRIPFASATNTLGDSANLVFDYTNKALGVGNGTTGGIVLGSTSVNLIGTTGTGEPYNGAVLATDTNSAALYINSGTVTGTGNSGQMLVRSGPTADGNSGQFDLASGDSSNGGSTGNVNIKTGNTSGARGTVNITGNSIYLDGTGADLVNLAYSPSDNDTASIGSTVASAYYVRTHIVQRATGTTTATLITGARAAKFMVYIQESATIKYMSEISVVSTNGTSGIDSVETNIIGTPTVPAGLSITASASSSIVQLTVSQTNSGIVRIEAIPVYYV